MTSSRSRIRSARRGSAALMSLLLMAVGATMVVGIYTTTQMNVQASASHGDTVRAQATAESGLQWFAWRLRQIPKPATTAGTISSTVADALWPSLQIAIRNDLTGRAKSAERPVVITADSLTSSPIALDGGDGRFVIEVRQHPLDASDPLDERYLQITSTATVGEARRSVTCDFKIDKKIRFAVAGRVPIQIGRNTIIEGPMGMATASKTPPYLIVSDFGHLTSALTTRINSFQAYVEANHDGFDNRFVTDSDEGEDAIVNGYPDTNDDGYIDEYDLFLAAFDANKDKRITKTEFTNWSTGKLYDENLFSAIDSLSGPQFDGDVPRLGYQDGVISNLDGYSKLYGTVKMAISQSAWASNLASSGKTIHDMMPGPISVDLRDQAPVKFSATSADIFDLSPANFEACAAGFRTRSGANAGVAARTPGVLVANTTLAVSDANGGFVNERTPLGSTSYQATYKRPIFRNMTLRNVIIPKGLNALFDNCVFEGVTFVDTHRDITTSGGSVTTNSNDGMSWSQRRLSGDTFSKDKVLIASGTATSGQTITQGSKNGNNLRFNNCTFNGPIAGNYSTAYTHFANSWEFTGSTLFDNQVDQTATIVSPQVNIEMGSFTDPSRAPSTLIGVVVAGNIDIRGTSVVDGSIIVTGDGAGNTTLGYFGPSDSDTNPTVMPEGGFGRLTVRYNSYRALPDGILLPVEVLPEPNSYRESE